MRGQLRHSIIAVGLAGLLVLTGCSSGHHPTANGPGGSTTTTPNTTDPSSPTTSGTGSASTSTTAQNSTSTTVLGPSGNPKNYPAAQANPPSLAGAYPHGDAVNLITVLKTLATYRDWVWSHPNPALVANYDLSTGPDYRAEAATVTQIRNKGWHAAPTPSEILWVKVTAQPTPQKQNGTPVIINGYAFFFGGSVTAVYNVVPVLMLTASGQPSGQQYNPPRTGEVASIITLAQGFNGQFRFDETSALNPPGGIPALEAQK
jgi:hypothetical protein